MGSLELSLNTADFSLNLGGRYLLESSTADGYLLEDGSGVLLLDTYIPQLGDPVTFTNPSWSGRVVSVELRNFVEATRNYVEATIAATNSTAAPGGTAPGDFSDVAAGGYYLQEDGIGKLILEDSTGDYLLEGTTFRYRYLNVKQSQNQDGTVTTYGSLETFQPGFQAGQTFLLTNADQRYSAQSFAITNVRITFIGANPPTPLYTIEFGDAYQTLQLAGGGVLTRQASTAVTLPGVAMPGGVLGYAQVTASQTGIVGVATDLTGLAVTVTVISGRRIKISAQALFLSTVADDNVGFDIFEGASQINSSQATMRPAATNISITDVLYLSPTAGVHTYKLVGIRSTGTGSVTMTAAANNPAFIAVEDAGT